ncbi:MULTISPECIES: hypothetical protein [Marinomonas]|jgi:hypothetical protein|uniref:Uncharacterized protein n=1 Tax=Marinomonas polaris DSM 16579 TaxID=1122206 RepID=A0A1M4ZIE6_9GAMM|nr:MULTISPECIES: hypothetical protein [Marinomonas]MBU1296032.1 hypothetical protein [Gammaproteobacteria bacterium]MBU1465457.1 hypothetical protein [Gammaproteobacteria bacterium]MBU2022471.1 hypothetical protein [Gammaproteobacteria bacterium]MBU2236893.1 hypothetical protein [Gammaproteobacteria bacterium]MBU2411490.1 hypothetical protein [Gammaproteobacteria bacterium]|tara:strand:+ start:8018 stop:8371 length:354 start_codon:yes stop_codon:yes gene_type:complete
MARVKKSRSMRGKLGKTGSKEMMKEQNKARKSSPTRRFVTKKSKERKEQAHKKLERLGLLPEKEAGAAPVRPRRFVFVKPVDEKAEQAEAMENVNNIDTDSEDLSLDELLSAFTEQK